MSKKQFAAMLVVAALAGLLGATARDWFRGQPAYAQAGSAVPGMLSAEQFRLIGPNGLLQATLGPCENGRELMFCDENAYPQVSLDMCGGNGPVFGLWDHTGVRYWVALQSDGRPTVVLRNREQKAAAMLRVRPDGTGEMMLLDEAERPRIVLGQDDNKHWGISVRDAAGRATWSAP